MPLAVVAAVGAVGAAAITANATSNAASQAASAAAQNNALQSSIYQQNSANAQPYIKAGTNAENVLQGFLGVGGDPQAAQSALDDYLNSTGYQFNLNQGLNAVSQSKAAGGMLKSGSALTALDSYATGLADSYGQQYEQNLQGLANTGQAAASGLAGTGQNYANAVSANNNNAATAAANAGLTSAGAINSLIGNAISAYGAGRGGSSFGGSASGGSTAALYNAFNIGG